MFTCASTAERKGIFETDNLRVNAMPESAPGFVELRRTVVFTDGVVSSCDLEFWFPIISTELYANFVVNPNKPLNADV